MPKFDITAFQEKARHYREDILTMVCDAGSGHIGGAFSGVEILVSLYHYKMRHNPQNPSWSQRDRFIMSKGHASALLYVTLADCGYFPKEELKTFRKLNSRLQGHVYSGVPGVEFSTGALGQGLSVSCGIALGIKLRQSDSRVYCLLGDGEIQEGQNWEAAMTASQHKLDNLCAILDQNKIQQNDLVSKIKNEEPLADKWRSFGWEVIEVDGHNFPELIAALDALDRVKEKPVLIIAHTVKGKGVSFMENQAKWHSRLPTPRERQAALEELGG